MEKLICKDVYYSYKTKYQTVKALNGVNADFEQGKFQAIIGKSGCGKTTLLSLLAGLDLPQSGEVLYDDQSLSLIDLDVYRRENVSVIYQSYNLLPLLTVLENVMYPMLLNKINVKDAKKAAMEKIKIVGLDEQYYRRFPSMLSGGEQQRVAIARALMSKAKVILADEPTGNLDTGNSKIVIDTLLNLAHNNGYCVIVVTHNLEIAELSDKITELVDGVSV